MTEFRDFTTPAPRPVPVILLVDISGSMNEHGKIGIVNREMERMIRAFADEKNRIGEIHVAVITFGADSARVHQTLTPAKSVTWQVAHADGNTPVGAAIRLATALVEDRRQIPNRAYLPTLVLVSDGKPTDEWRAPLKEMNDSPRAAKATRLAIAIGEDADLKMLAEFLGDSESQVFRAEQATSIAKFFRYVTMSVTTGSTIGRAPRPTLATWEDDA